MELISSKWYSMTCFCNILSQKHSVFKLENEFDSFTLYFLAFDHSDGAESLEEKRAKRTNREGNPFHYACPTDTKYNILIEVSSS